MAELYSEGARGSTGPEPDPRSPVTPHLQGTAPSLDDTARPQISSTPSLSAVDPPAPSGTVRTPLPPAEPFEAGVASLPRHSSGIHLAATRLGSAVGAAERSVRRRFMEKRVLPFPSQGNPEGESSAASATAERLDRWSEQARESLQNIRTELGRSRGRARQWAETYPLHTIAAFAGAGFLLGIAIRLARRSRG